MDMPVRIVVTIIGLGPRGLSIVERIVAKASMLDARVLVEVILVDPGECGQGVHSSRQPEYLLTNTIANQVTIFSRMEGEGGSWSRAWGPSFTEWAAMVGYRRLGRNYHRVGEGCGEEIGAHDYLPRKMLGEYLSWAFDYLTGAAPENLRFSHFRNNATSVQRLDDGGFLIQLDNRHRFVSDYVFLTTGHGRRAPTDRDRTFRAFVERHTKLNGRLGYLQTPYPIDNLVSIPPDATVGVQGMGLTAYDVVTDLTEGRGGRFVPNGDGLEYIPSGREPRIVLFSRNSLPFAARGVNQKGIDGCHRARFFTDTAIEDLRSRARVKRESDQLDLEADVLPLLFKEMCYAYRAAWEGNEPDQKTFEPGAQELASLRGALFPLEGRVFNGLPEFRAFVLETMRLDLIEAGKGNLASPVKAATDVLRDVRDGLRLCIENRGLLPESHRTFLNEYGPLFNRVAFGPPKRRNEEWLALFDQGVLDIAAGPGSTVVRDRERAKFRIDSRFGRSAASTEVDVLIVARVDTFLPEYDSSPLMRDLVKTGLVRPYANGWFHPGGIDIDDRNHPISMAGEVLDRMWAIGYPVEGPHYYTYALPRPHLESRHCQEAERSVEELFRGIREDALEKRASTRAARDEREPATSVPVGMATKEIDGGWRV